MYVLCSNKAEDSDKIMTWVDYCHTCKQKWEYEDLDQKEHEKRFIEHWYNKGHGFTTYEKNSEEGQLHARMARVPLDDGVEL